MSQYLTSPFSNQAAISFHPFFSRYQTKIRRRSHTFPRAAQLLMIAYCNTDHGCTINLASVKRGEGSRHTSFQLETTFLAGHAGGHPSGCPHRAGLILSKKKKKSAIFNENFEIRERIPKRCKGVHCVDLGESFPTSIYLQNLASIQPRTS